MKKNKIAIAIGLVLSLIAIWLFLDNRKGTIREELKDFAFADTASITKIFLADKENQSVVLEKIKPGEWKVNNKYKVRKNAINLLLFTIKNLEVKSPVGKKAQENAIKKLSSNAVKIEIYDKQGLKKVYYVGGETQDQLGTYMLLANPETMQNSSVPFIIHIPGFNGYLTPRYFTAEADWRERVLFSYVPTEIKSVKIEIPRSPELSYEIMLVGENKYEIKNLSTNKSLENMNTIALKQYLSYFQNIQFGAPENSINQIVKDSIVNSVPLNIITVTDIKGQKSKVKLFLKAASPDSPALNGKPYLYDQERMHALINDEKDLVSVQYFVFGKLLPSMDYFKQISLKK